MNRIKVLKKLIYKTSFFLLLLIAFCCNNAVAQTTFTSEEDLKKEARKLFDNEQYAEAYPLYSQLLSVYPKDPNYNYRFGICMLYTSENKEKPISYLEYASKQPDVEKDVFFFLGKAYHVNYRFDDAINSYNRFKREASAYQQKKFQVDKQIDMCRNGKTLLKNITDLQVLDKKQLSDKEFFRSYDLSSIGGKLLVKPEDFQSSLDKKAKQQTIIYLAKNNNQIFYSSYGTDGKNGKDIYMVTKLSNGEWSLPTNLGTTINTDADEDYPFLHPNGMVLYFCSKGHNSMGGYDIFKSTRSGQTGAWSEPVNMDFSINTPDDDIMYVTDSLEKTAYFSSKRNSPDGMIDVYKISTERKAVEVAVINGTIGKDKDGQIIKSKITVKNAANGELIGLFTSDPQTGQYNMSVPGGSKLLFTVESEGYKTESEVVVLPVQRVFKPFRQEINYEAGTEKLLVKNSFDESVDDNNYLLALNFIKEKAKMDVNANEAMFKDTPVVTDPSTVKKDTVSTALKTDDTKIAASITNVELVKIAYDDAEDVQKEAKEIKNQANQALSFASQKNQDAQTKYTEADAAAKQGDAAGAAEKRKEGDKISRETVAAFNLAKKLDSDASAKQDEADLSLNYAKELDVAAKAQNSSIALTQLDEQKKRLESLSQKPKGADNAYNNLKVEADNKQKEAERTKEKSQSLAKEIKDIDVEIKRQEQAISATNNEQLKEGLRGQIKDLQDDQVKKRAEIVDNDAKAIVLEKESANLKNEAEIVNGMISQIKTGGEVPVNVTSIDKQKLQEQVNGYQMKEADVVKADVAANKTEIKPATKVKDETTTTTSQQNTSAPKENDTTQPKRVTIAQQNNTETSKQNDVTTSQQNTNAPKENDTTQPKSVTATQQNNTETSKQNDVPPAQQNDVTPVQQNNGSPTQTTTTLAPTPVSSYDKKYISKLDEANEINDEYTRETTKASYYKSWADSIAANVAEKKSELSKAKDEPTKKDLEKAITSLEAEAKEKQEMSEKSKAKAKASISGAIVGTTTAGSDTAKKETSNSVTPNETTKPTVTTATNTTQQPVGNNTNVAEQIVEKTTEKQIPGTTANTTQQQPENTGNPVNAATTKPEEKTATAPETTKQQALENNINVADQTTAKSTDKQQTPPASTQQQRENTGTSVNETTAKSAEKTVTAPVNTANTQQPVGNTSNPAKTGEPIQGNDPAQADKNVNPLTAPMAAKNVELLNQASNSAKEAQDLHGQAMTLRNDAYAKSDPAERDQALEKANDIEKQALQKQQESAEMTAKVKTEEYKKKDAQLAAYSKSLSGNQADDIMMADMIKDEAKYYFDLSQKSREKAAVATVFSVKQEDLNLAEQNEKIAFEKQAKAAEMYSKFKPGEAPVVAVNTQSSNNTQLVANTTTKPQTNNTENATKQSSTITAPSKPIETTTGNEKPVADNTVAPANNSTQAKQTTSAKQSDKVDAGNTGTTNTKQEDNPQSAANLVKPADAKTQQQTAAKEQQPVNTNAQQPEANKVPVKTFSTNYITQQKLREVQDSREYGHYVDLKTVSDSIMQISKLQYIDADNFQKQADAKNKEADPILKEIDKIPAGTPVPDSLTKRAEQLRAEAHVFQQKADSVKAIGKNTEEIGQAKQTESDMFLATLDENKANDIELAYNGKVEAPPAAVVIRSNKNTQKNTLPKAPAATPKNTPQTKPVTAADNKPKSPASTPATKSAVLNITALSEGFEINNRSVYSEANPIPVDPKLPEGLVFKVQIGAFKNPIPQNSFKGMNPLTAERTQSGMIRYTAGLFKDLDPAKVAKGKVQGLGYTDAFIVSFYNGKRITYNEAMAMLNGGKAPVEANATQPTSTPPATTPQTSANTSVNPGVVVPANTAQSNDGSLAKTTDIATVSGVVYTVQVGVYSKQVTAAQLYNIESLYTETMNNGLKRYTSGAFTDINDAMKAKDAIVKRGIRDAFIIVYKDGKRIAGNDLAVGNNTKPAVNNSGPVVSADGIVFKVQIGAYKSEVPIDVANKLLSVSSKGVNISKDETGTTIYTVGNFKTFDEAVKTKNELLSSGIADAFVVAYNKAKRMNLDEAKQITNK
jgi:hypothetical protein